MIRRVSVEDEHAPPGDEIQPLRVADVGTRVRERHENASEGFELRAGASRGALIRRAEIRVVGEGALDVEVDLGGVRAHARGRGVGFLVASGRARGSRCRGGRGGRGGGERHANLVAVGAGGEEHAIARAGPRHPQVRARRRADAAARGGGAGRVSVSPSCRAGLRKSREGDGFGGREERDASRT